MKIKSKTKKILVLSVMVVLLITTGVLNFVLNDKLTTATKEAGVGGNTSVVETFFASCKSDRQTYRDSQFMALKSIVDSPNSSPAAKKQAEDDRIMLLARMELEHQIETVIKSKGFNDAIITMNDKGVNVIVGATELTQQQMIQITHAVVSNSSTPADDVHIMKYK